MFKTILFLFIYTFSTLLVAEENNAYGWSIPHTSLNVGGYLDMSYDEQREDKFLFNDLALLFFAHKDKFSLVGEFELSNISLEGKSNQRSDVDLTIERLELGYLIDDTQKIKVGRFNSFIGFWNLEPISILQDTTTKPHVIQYMFPQATTGVWYQYAYDTHNVLSVTLQNNVDIGDEDYVYKEDTIIVDKHMAMDYRYEDELLAVFLSSGVYRESYFKNRYFYAGMGLKYENDFFEVQSELFTQQSNEDKDKPYSGYIQTLFHIQQKQDIVLRVEGYKDNIVQIEEQNYLLGYVYRPFHNVSFKVEYNYHSKELHGRVVSSLSVLF